MDDTFKLLTFNPYDSDIKENDMDIAESLGNKDKDDNDNNQGFRKQIKKEFLVQMFAINEKGQTASIYVEGFTPFFYAKVGDTWKEKDKVGFIGQLKNDLGKMYENCITEAKLIKRKKLYGFDNNKQHSFILIKFKNEAAMKKAKSLWYLTISQGKDDYKRILHPHGYSYENTETILYEAQIPPLLRLFHMKTISPSGWIALPRSKTLKHQNHTTSCTY